MNKLLQKRIEEAAKKTACPQCVFNDGGTCNNDDDCKLLDDFVGLMTFALQNQWISIEEALPPRTHFLDGKETDTSIYVFVRYKNGAVTSAWYCYCTKVWYFAVGRKGDNSIRDEITHWMPIPQLKGGKDE